MFTRIPFSKRPQSTSDLLQNLSNAPTSAPQDWIKPLIGPTSETTKVNLRGKITKDIRGFQLMNNDADRHLPPRIPGCSLPTMPHLKVLHWQPATPPLTVHNPLPPMSCWRPALPPSLLPRHQLKILHLKPAILPLTINNPLPPMSLGRPVSVICQLGTVTSYLSLLYPSMLHLLPPQQSAVYSCTSLTHSAPISMHSTSPENTAIVHLMTQIPSSPHVNSPKVRPPRSQAFHS